MLQVIICVKPQYIQSSIGLLLFILVVGFSNGVLGTVTMMRAPLLVSMHQRETAAYLMVHPPTCLISTPNCGIYRAILCQECVRKWYLHS